MITFKHKNGHSMDETEIEKLIERRITEAKLDIAEKRLTHTKWIAGIILVVVGMIIPFYSTYRSTDEVNKALSNLKYDYNESSKTMDFKTESNSQLLSKSIESMKSEIKEFYSVQNNQTQLAVQKVDQAIHDMQIQFKELAGMQLRKPQLECYYNGKPLEASVINVVCDKERYFFLIEIRNSGDGSAKNIRMRIYFALDQDIDDCLSLQIWTKSPLSDESTYSHAYDISDPLAVLDARQSHTYEIEFDNPAVVGKKFSAMVKIFYEQPEPKKYNFVVDIQAK